MDIDGSYTRQESECILFRASSLKRSSIFSIRKCFGMMSRTNTLQLFYFHIYQSLEVTERYYKKGGRI